MSELKILVVDDEPGYQREIKEYLSSCGFSVATAGLPSAALKIMSTEAIDIAIIDLRLPEMDGLTLMRKIREIDAEIAVIMISGHGDMQTVLHAMREGAIDFFPKPFNLMDIRLAIERTRKYIELHNDLNEMKITCENLLEMMNQNSRIPLIGESPGMKEVFRLMSQVSPSRNTDVLIQGESGTGKELVARGIHYLGLGKEKVFFDVNCTAIPDSLFESEFFGHTRNAFTGALTDKKGRFEIANGGTLFLDEIGDLPLAMQAKLLRVLEERTVRKVGSNIDIPLNLRVIASTNKDLKALIESKLFREDLFYRLSRFPIYIPALRDRREDIAPLLELYNRHFSTALKKPYKKISEKSLNRLLDYRYPGNVRELKNMMEKAIILSDTQSRELNLNCFPELNLEACPPVGCLNEANLDLAGLEAMEMEMIHCAMHKSGNNRTHAAALLKISRSSLNRRIEKYGLDYS